MKHALILLAAAVLSGAWPALQSHAADDHDHGHGAVEAAEAEAPKGPHGGRLFEQDGFAVELVLYETGVPPEFHVYAAHDGEPLPPEAVAMTVALTRLDGQVDRIDFQPLKRFLRGQGVVAEPHSFDVEITAQYQGQTYRWTYASYEGRTEIPAALAREAGIETGTAGPAVIADSLALTGRVQVDPDRLAPVRARFPGVVQRIDAQLGAAVRAGEALARIQSDESLQTYALTAPIAGVILKRDVQPGMTTGDAPLFVIADLSRVWVELDVFSRHLGRVRPGQAVVIETLDGVQMQGQIEWVSPVAVHASQSVPARVVLDNPDGRLRPGQFVRARVTVAEHPVQLAVRQTAIQRFRDFQVVFARIGETYEVRMLELGRQDAEWAEVRGGLKPGSEYVTRNSYLIKADIEKSGASHGH